MSLISGLFMGLAKEGFDADFVAASNRSHLTHADTMGAKTTLADLGTVNTAGLKSDASTGVNTALTNDQKADAAGAVAGHREEIGRYTGAIREENMAAKNAAVQGNGVGYQQAAAVGPQAGTSGVNIATNMVGGPIVNAISMLLDLVGDRKALSPGEANQFVSELHDKVAEKANTIQRNKELGIEPNKDDKAILRLAKLDKDQFEDFLKTPVEDLPEMKAAEKLMIFLDKFEEQLGLSEVKTEQGLEAERNGQDVFVELPSPVVAKIDEEPEDYIDSACLETNVLLMENSFPYAGLHGLLNAHWCGDKSNYTSILASIYEPPVASEAPAAKQTNNTLGFTGPKPVPSVDDQDAATA